jgi:hypothetical protein
MELKVDSALFISVLALVFTIVSFWWQHARLGKFIVAAPQQYGSTIYDDTLTIRIPIVLYNTGARPIIVQTFRLRFLDLERKHLQWVATCDNIFSRETNFRRAFAVQGRASKDMVLQFQRHDFGNLEHGDPVRLQLDILLANQRAWKKLVEFSILVLKGGFRSDFAVIDLVGGDETGEQ